MNNFRGIKCTENEKKFLSCFKKRIILLQMNDPEWLMIQQYTLNLTLNGRGRKARLWKGWFFRRCKMIFLELN